MIDTLVTPSRAILHAHLARTFKDVTRPNMGELTLFTRHLLETMPDPEMLAPLLAEVIAAAMRGSAAGYSVNPQNDIVDHVMAVCDSSFSEDYRH